MNQEASGRLPVATMSIAEMVATMRDLATEVTARVEAHDEFDLDDYAQKLLDNPMFDKPDTVTPFVVADHIIAIPSIPPLLDVRGTKANGKHVMSGIRIPGHEPYASYEEDTPTFIATYSFTLKTPRKVSFHQVIPGMEIFFHHYVTKNGVTTRDKVSAMMVVYDSSGEVTFIPRSRDKAMTQITPRRG